MLTVCVTPRPNVFIKFLNEMFLTMKDTKYHPSSSVRRPSGLTVHTCGENRVILPQRLTFFYCRRYIKRKEIVLPSTSDSMPLVSTMLYTLKVLTMLCALHVQVQKCRAGKHVQEDKKKIRRRDLVGGLFSISPHQESSSCSLLRTGPIFNPLYQCMQAIGLFDSRAAALFKHVLMSPFQTCQSKESKEVT